MDNPSYDSAASLDQSKDADSMKGGKKEPKKTDSSKGLEIQQKVGLFSGVAFIVSNMIGTGIFITPGGVLQRSGSVGSALVLWAAGGLLSILGSLAYAELGTLIPKTGGEYAYYLDGFRSLHPFWGSVPAFMYSWLLILLIRPAGYAAGLLSLSRYTVRPIVDATGLCMTSEDEDMLLKLVAILYLGLIIAINCFSVDWAIRISNLLTMAKLMALAILIGCGIYQLSNGETQYLAQGFEGSVTNFGGIAMAFYGCLWAYDGWNTLNYIMEELKNPYVNLPRAIMIGLPLVTVMYLLANVAYLTVLSPEEFIASKAVAVDVANRMLGPAAFIIPLGVVCSAFGNVLTGGFHIARLSFAAGREGHMVSVLSYVHVDSRTPVPSLVLLFALTIVMILAKDLTALIDFCIFVIWIFYVLSMILVLVLRKTRPDAPRPYRVPFFIPIIIIIIGSYLVVAPIIAYPTYEYLYILGAIIIGMIVYVAFIHRKFYFSCMGSLTRVIQLILNVGPSVKPALD